MPPKTNSSLRLREQHIWQFYVPCDIFTNTMFTHLEVPNAFLHPKRWDHVTLTREYTQNEHHCLKRPLIQTYIQAHIGWGGGQVGICINKIASKGPIVVTKFDATRSIITSYDSNSTLNSIPSEFHSSHPQIKNLTTREFDKVELPLEIHTHYKPQMRMRISATTFKQHQCAPLVNLKSITHCFFELHYNQKVAPLIGITKAKRLQDTSWESKRMETSGVENGGESGNTTHPTQLILGQCEPLDGRMGFIHGAHWSLVSPPNNEAWWGGSIFRRLHSTHANLVGATSYPERLEVAPYKTKVQFLKHVFVNHFTSP